LFWAAIAVFSTIRSGIPDVFPADRTQNGGLVSAMTSGLNDLLLPSVFAAQPPTTPQSYQLRKGSFLGKFKVTFYWMVEEDNYQGKKTSPLYGSHGELIGRFTPAFVKDFQMEACALLSDGRVISYMKKANRCEVVDAPVGCGYTLSELKSVAVDPSMIPVGSTIYVPEAEGSRLTGGGYHDGIFRAHDIGSAIKGDRLDVYVGLKSNMDVFRSTALCNPGYVSVYLLQ
jgi:3D (Asp-Asp-Asp) domain-containing protein